MRQYNIDAIRPTDRLNDLFAAACFKHGGKLHVDNKNFLMWDTGHGLKFDSYGDETSDASFFSTYFRETDPELLKEWRECGSWKNKQAFEPEVFKQQIEKFFKNDKKNNTPKSEVANVAVITETKPDIKEIKINPDEPFTAYQQFLETVYPGDSLIRTDRAFYRYDGEKWKPTSVENIESEIFSFLKTSGYIEAIQMRRKNVREFLNSVVSFIKRHNDRGAHENPFTDAAGSPYIHFKNGCVKLQPFGNGVEWFSRSEYDSGFFRELFPLYCSPYLIDEKMMFQNFSSNILKMKAPIFHYFLKGLIPEDVLKNCVSEDLETELILKLFAQIFAYTLSPIKPQPYFFMFHGDQNTGKSTVANLIKEFIGYEFAVVRALDDVTKNQFSFSSLHGAKVYIDDDLATNATIPDDFIKKATGKQRVSIEKKFQEPMHGVLISVAIFLLGNYLPSFQGKEGLERRAVLIPCNNKLKNVDSFLIEKMTGQMPRSDGNFIDERPYIAAFAVWGWLLLIENNFKFIFPEWVRDATDKWLESGNSIGQFFSEIIDEKEGSLKTVKRNTFYQAYSEFCKSSNYHSIGKRRFYEEIRRMPKIEEIKTSGLQSYRFMNSKNFEISEY